MNRKQRMSLFPQLNEVCDKVFMLLAAAAKTVYPRHEGKAARLSAPSTHVCPPEFLSARQRRVGWGRRALQRLVRIPLAVGIGGLLLSTSGCTVLRPAQSTSRYYLLTATKPVASSSVGALPAAHARYVVRLQPIELSDYLSSKSIVIRSHDNEINFALFHRWAEPLDTGIRRVLAEDLRGAPSVAEVLTDQTTPSSQEVYTFSVQVLACEGVHAQGQNAVNFAAAWQLIGPGDSGRQIDDGVFRARPSLWNGQDYGELAAQLSRDIAALSKSLVKALQQNVPARPGVH